MIPCPECPVCIGHSRDRFKSHNGYELWRCTGCGLIYLDPMPGPDDIAALYTNAYDGASTGYFAKARSKLRRSRHRVREIRRKVRRDGGHTPRLLDVGCNGGFLVEAARQYGFDAAGVDLDEISIDYARRTYPGGMYFCGALADIPADLVGDGFDAVYSSEVIEHVPDVRGFVRDIARVMRPGGVLYLTTPDITHWRRPKDVTQWNGFCPPSHCIYFSPTNIVRLLDDAGFDLIRNKFNLKPGIKLLARRAG